MSSLSSSWLSWDNYQNCWNFLLAYHPITPWCVPRTSIDNHIYKKLFYCLLFLTFIVVGCMLLILLLSVGYLSCSLGVLFQYCILSFSVFRLCLLVVFYLWLPLFLMRCLMECVTLILWIILCCSRCQT